MNPSKSKALILSRNWKLWLIEPILSIRGSLLESLLNNCLHSSQFSSRLTGSTFYLNVSDWNSDLDSQLRLSNRSSRIKALELKLSNWSFQTEAFKLKLSILLKLRVSITYAFNAFHGQVPLKLIPAYNRSTALPYRLQETLKAERPHIGLHLLERLSAWVSE